MRLRRQRTAMQPNAKLIFTDDPVLNVCKKTIDTN
jgi:hypothetical protein